MTLLFAYLFLALSISFLCSLMESVLLSTPTTYLRANANTNNRGLQKMIKSKIDVDKSLSAILSLNTIAHTVGAAGVGSEASQIFGEQYLGVVSAILTISILLLTEIVPKTIGTNYWKNMTGLIGYMINVTVIISYPLVILSAFLTRIISKNKIEHTTSREEISALTLIGTKEGIFLEKENKIIQNLLKLKTMKVSEIITPRVVVTVANENMQLVDFLKNKDYLKFSRIPIFTENDENITGYVFRQNVFEKLAEDQENLRLKDIRREIVITPNTKPIFDLWEQLLSKKEHIALVVDEYGGMDGIVTMEDVIETLLGFEIIDEKDTIADMQQYARDRWKKRQMKYKHLDNLSPQSDQNKNI